MDPRRDTPPPWPPVPRPPDPPPTVPDPLPASSDPPSPAVPDPPPSSGPRVRWRKLTRSRRGAAGLAIGAAALLLWPFSGWSWIPWLAGVGLLVVLRLLRLDDLLRGWALHLGGLVVVAGLMLSTTPWAWALAASIGVLLAGLAQWPLWRLAAVGALACAVSGVGFGLATHRAAEFERQIQARAGDPLRVQLGEMRPGRVLPAMLQAIALDDADPVCRLLIAPAEAALLESTRTPDCAAAVSELHRRLPPATGPIDADSLPLPVATATGWYVDACATPWAAAAGRELGRVLIGQTAPSVQRFVVTGFAPCPPASDPPASGSEDQR